MASTDTGRADATTGAAATIALCFAAAMLEGLDLQSVGVAARKIAGEFHLMPAAMGWVANASIIGLLPGAAIGGRLADRIGRKAVLVGAVLAFGLFTLLTTIVHDYTSLLAARFLTGLGLGAALPNLIALSSEASPAHARSRVVSIMYAGVPTGGAVASLVSIAGGGTMDWRTVFYLGGVAPIVVAPLLVFALPESSEFRRRLSQARDGAVDTVRASVGEALFGGGRAAASLLLWVSFFFTLLVVYLLLNWLPSLLVGKGFTPAQAGLVQIVFNIGGAVGSLVFGWFLDHGSRRATAVVMYAGVIAFLAALAYVHGFGPTAAVGIGIGLFAVGGQIVLYALAPIYYPTLMRGTGVGAAVAIGRLGSIAGPILAGQLLSSGRGATAVLLAAVPGLVVAALTGVALVMRRPADD
jgi:AAHS family 3-hydroxyphenylpropionic acid transporter